ncbi:similarity with ornithine decarboxylase DCOR_YEAST [Encephalitozoon cuniculi GB-M1]|uniref:Similarity with ornithine decarboxylase DCOR_YEAST n=2 Tax=Encephalitozoon cuniculi TaxID=6035 RepID=Q8SUT0_ENCCU|nr:uncharacterized protein ECU08_0360 [Encephalitozoon cuniculi GB-M1]AGE95067.1 ornithine decarboxylase [Encephalitozoon cuniculi]KMV65563.1 hypothetical protein M970_080330 [Encephalitozoon cuniculi EcunIII-L]UYI26962.1 hypothetical protein J0A71_04g08070 [Encephalitozoon cuniculi]CAD26341.1 similarity with ornithine decarboxylase DCOR_YEAST [Encephalitozoon cuniculi GB-M1]
MSKSDKEDIDESGVSYEYTSSDSPETVSSEISEYEEEYFGEASEEESSKSSEAAAWEDSDDDEKLREEYKKTATWLDGKQAKKQVEARKKRLRFEYERHLFFSKCKIKQAKAHGEYLVVVDTYNNIYILRNFQVHKTLWIEMFGISDFVYTGGAILFSSSKQSNLKEVTFDGEVRNISIRAIEGIRRMISIGDSIYIVGEQLALLNSAYEVVEVIEGRFVDVAVSEDFVYAMCFSGEIVVLTPGLQILRKVSLEDKFDFRSIHFFASKVFVGMGMGMKVFDKEMNPIREFKNLKDEVTGFTGHGDYVVYGSRYTNSLKIVLPDIRCFSKFPFNTIRIPPIKVLDSDGRNVIICSGRSVSVLRIKLE